jgi:hypothetical protein
VVTAVMTSVVTAVMTSVVTAVMTSVALTGKCRNREQQRSRHRATKRQLFEHLLLLCAPSQLKNSMLHGSFECE